MYVTTRCVGTVRYGSRYPVANLGVTMIARRIQYAIITVLNSTVQYCFWLLLVTLFVLVRFLSGRGMSMSVETELGIPS